jgi:hypothetical protein
VNPFIGAQKKQLGLTSSVMGKLRPLILFQTLQLLHQVVQSFNIAGELFLRRYQFSVLQIYVRQLTWRKTATRWFVYSKNLTEYGRKTITYVR